MTDEFAEKRAEIVREYERRSNPLSSGICEPSGVESEADELACVREVLSRAGLEVLALSRRVSGDGWAAEVRWRRTRYKKNA